MKAQVGLHTVGSEVRRRQAQAIAFREAQASRLAKASRPCAGRQEFRCRRRKTQEHADRRR